jgi:hypothetical protein
MTTEQPPSASREALDIAECFPDHLDSRHPQRLAQAIDALCEQRVSAETERILNLCGPQKEEAWAREWMAVADLIRKRIRAPAERPAPPVCKRCKDRGYINCVRTYHGEHDEHWQEPCPDCVALASTGEQPPSSGISCPHGTIGWCPECWGEFSRCEHGRSPGFCPDCFTEQPQAETLRRKIKTRATSPVLTKIAEMLTP